MANPGILSFDDINHEITNRGLIRHSDANLVKPCSYDLRIGTVFIADKTITSKSADANQVILQPGDIVSILTLEELVMPPDIAGTAFAINAMSSDGLLVLNPGHVDPGFEGPLSVRLINIRATPKAILLGMPTFTIIFEYLPGPTSRPYTNNVPRSARELDSKARDVEQNPGSLYALVSSGKNRPLMTAQEVRNLITEHWMTRVTFTASIAAAIFGLFALLKPTPNFSPSTSSAPSPIIATPSQSLFSPTPSPPSSLTIPPRPASALSSPTP